MKVRCTRHTYEDDNGEDDGGCQQPHRDAEHDLLEATHRLHTVDHGCRLAEEREPACTDTASEWAGGCMEGGRGGNDFCAHTEGAPVSLPEWQ